MPDNKVVRRFELGGGTVIVICVVAYFAFITIITVFGK